MQASAVVLGPEAELEEGRVYEVRWIVCSCNVEILSGYRLAWFSSGFT